MTDTKHSAVELAAFEHWAQTCDGNCNSEDLRKYSSLDPNYVVDGLMYFNQLVQRDWVVWQARAAIASASPAGEPTAWQRSNRDLLDNRVKKMLVAEGGDSESCARGYTIPLYAAPIPAAAPKAALTEPELDALIDKVLRASGSTIRNYSMQKSKNDMRTAMRECLAVSGPNAALVEALQYALLNLRGEEADTDGVERMGRAALAAAGVKP